MKNKSVPVSDLKVSFPLIPSHSADMLSRTLALDGVENKAHAAIKRTPLNIYCATPLLAEILPLKGSLADSEGTAFGTGSSVCKIKHEIGLGGAR